MLPKINFRYSSVYDGFLKANVLGKRKFKYPTSRTKRKILNYIKKVEKLWRKDEKKILREISKITKLPWRERVIYCYIIEKGNFGLHDPLTQPIHKKLDVSLDFLVHELIHRIFASGENLKKSNKAWNYIYRKYKNESKNTKIHIVIHAIHSHIYLKFFNTKRLKRDIKWAVPHGDYRRAWQIVQKGGYRKIINEFTKRIQ